tara:strand:+ start:13 stop:939 length:927 start_codon:yes stop_codon:yes gene_type:complete
MAFLQKILMHQILLGKLVSVEFPRIKPSPVPKVNVIPEYLVKGKQKKDYATTKLAFNVPWMGVVAMAFSNYSNFYKALWEYMLPLSKSLEFYKLCKKLEKKSYSKAEELNPNSIINNLKYTGYSNFEIKEISKTNDIFTVGNMPYITMATIARVFLENGKLLNRKGFSSNEIKRIPCRKENLLLIEEHHASADIKKVYESIRKNIGLPFINTDYRAFARWPSYFNIAWNNFLPILLSKEYNEKVLDIHNFIINLVLNLPNPKGISADKIIRAATKDNLKEVKRIVSLFQWLLPGLILNVACMRKQISK